VCMKRAVTSSGSSKNLSTALLVASREWKVEAMTTGGGLCTRELHTKEEGRPDAQGSLGLRSLSKEDGEIRSSQMRVWQWQWYCAEACVRACVRVRLMDGVKARCSGE